MFSVMFVWLLFIVLNASSATVPKVIILCSVKNLYIYDFSKKKKNLLKSISGFTKDGYDQYGYDISGYDIENCNYSFKGPFATLLMHRVWEILHTQSYEFLVTLTKTCQPLKQLPDVWFKQFWMKPPEAFVVGKYLLDFFPFYYWYLVFI